MNVKLELNSVRLSQWKLYEYQEVSSHKKEYKNNNKKKYNKIGISLNTTKQNLHTVQKQQIATHDTRRRAYAQKDNVYHMPHGDTQPHIL